jgi:YD repeat-containing protein
MKKHSFPSGQKLINGNNNSNKLCLELIISLVFITGFTLNVLSKGYSQLDSHLNNGTPTPEFLPPSPHAANLGQFGAVPVGLFTGTAQYTLPLYEFKMKNLTLPINISYSSNGLIVDKVSGWTGFDWNLSAGGIINRIQKGKHDKPGIRPDYPNWSSMNNTARVNYLTMLESSPIDLDPDIFVYNFLGNSGKFIIDENGIPLPIPYSNIKIETNLPGSGTTEFNFFNITTTDGVIFKFHKIATTSSSNEPSRPNSWYLSRIVHPVGDSITFTYDSEHLLQASGLQRSITAFLFSDQAIIGCDGSTKHILFEQMHSNQVHYLNNIELHGHGKVLFYKTKNRLDCHQDYKLDSLRILNHQNSLIKTISFNYTFPISNVDWPSPGPIGNGPLNNYRYRMFLNSLKISGTNTLESSIYNFSYYELEKLPSRFSYAQDHWGYFNGKYNNDLLQLNKVPVQHQGHFAGHIGSSNRSPDPLFARVGMLKKITWPTKGYTDIDYEGHLDGSNREFGGCRVLRTKSYAFTDDPKPIVKKYQYQNAQSACDTIYYKELVYEYVYNNVFPYYCFYGELNSNSIYKMFYTDNSNINYGRVNVLHGENAEYGKETHSFYTQMDAPGTPINGNQITPLVYSNTGWFNGTKLKTEQSDNTNIKVSEEQTIYNLNEQRNLRIIKCLRYNYRFLLHTTYSPYINYCDLVTFTLTSKWAYPQQRQVNSFFNGEVVSSIQTYEHNNQEHALLTKEQHITSDGDYITKHYYYPHDYNNVQNFNTLKIANIIEKPIDIRTYNKGKLIEGTQYRYNNVGQLVNEYRFDSNASDILHDPNSPYTFSEETEIIYNQTHKNVIGVKSKTNPDIAYIWGYNHTLPIAKVENANYDRIAYSSFENGHVDGGWTCGHGQFHDDNITGKSSFEPQGSNLTTKNVIPAGSYIISMYIKRVNPSNSGLIIYNNGQWTATSGDSQDWVYVEKHFGLSVPQVVSLNVTGLKIDEIRLYPSDAQMTTYTHDPLVGVTSITDPRGLTTRYEYDGFGRLKRVIDHEGKVLQEHDYNYAKQE